ncbi:bifunctional folylpolyglutamate synthase/dihydrofolate synthase [Desulfobotulus sp. H1]|uniref:Dihydrofolate synthase/folylpolyglutamate synthase n=1 Tax=Desulfobotulus pelophilus TaxID=2823377 RepID=A0ABT3N5A1_9BACT|nr:folylpolyglutamate synthase/dihydrofolate synthase family protein [Desulfobotulus pelophilus]MCW7752632.1 bifunctional folylpolyglutamate synthase/dihydrofolate synthase [Desulfobotulus pelophilus]
MTDMTPHFSHLFQRQRLGIRPGLEGITRLLAHLGDPQQYFPVIHVAGTNGKGSVASLIAAILQAAGLRTGLYTSPHLVHFSERFQINGATPDNQSLNDLVTRIEAADREQNATFFEFTTAMAFLHFARSRVDMAVMETGMGGRWDATTACHPALCVITGIGMDHKEFLGDTLAAIASEKAGIIKPGIPVIAGSLAPEALDVITRQAENCKAPLFVMGQNFCTEKTRDSRYIYTGKTIFKDLHPGLEGEHQADNMAIAIAAVETITSLMTTPVLLDETILHKALTARKWPARLQTLATSPLILLDGAHNPQAAEALAAYLRQKTSEPRTLVFGVLEDKDAVSILHHLTPLFSKFILTRPQNSRSLHPSALADIFQGKHSETLLDAPEALARAISITPANGTICIAGSLYLAGEILRGMNEGILPF